MSTAVELPGYVLPPSLIGHAELGRLVRELEVVDNELERQRVRAHAGAAKTGTYQLPVMSRALTDLVQLNKLDLTDGKLRDQLRTDLRRLKDHAPAVHLTFATEADPESLQKLTAWIRKELHPQALVSVGLQPSIIGGVYVRTPNHVHDYSIRSLLQSKQDVIVADIEELAAHAG